MQTIVTVITVAINPFKRLYTCLCGHKALGRKELVAHLNTHPHDTIGHIDYTTGKVIF